MSHTAPRRSRSAQPPHYVSPFTVDGLLSGSAISSAAAPTQHDIYLYGITIGRQTTVGSAFLSHAAGANAMRAAAQLGSATVIVGGGGLIATSTDGTAYTRRSAGTNSEFKDIAVANGTAVAVGDTGLVRYSTDGVSWGTPTASNTGTTNIGGVATDGTTWVLAGSSGLMRYATDPAGTWGTPASPGFGSTTITTVRYGGSAWVAVGFSGSIRTATDPTGTWSGAAAPNFSTGIVWDVAYGGSTWVATGASGRIRYTGTPSGTWLTPASVGFSASDTITTIASDGTRWVAGSSVSSNNIRSTSDPSGTWGTPLSGPMFPDAYSRAAFFGGRFYMSGGGNGNHMFSALGPGGPWTAVGSLHQIGLYRPDGTLVWKGEQFQAASDNRSVVYDASVSGKVIPPGTYLLALWVGQYGIENLFRNAVSPTNRTRPRYRVTGATTGLPDSLSPQQETSGYVAMFGFTTR